MSDSWPQPVPPEVGDILADLRRIALAAKSDADRRRAWGRFLGYVDALKANGWREGSSLARHLELSHETIRQCRLKFSALPPDPAWPVPDAPRRPPPPPREPRWKRLTDEQVRELAKLRERSSRFRGPVVGYDRENDPDWIAGRELAARVSALVGDGYSINGIADQLGIGTLALRTRLARHGYLRFPPSVTPRWARERAAS